MFYANSTFDCLTFHLCFEGDSKSQGCINGTHASDLICTFFYIFPKEFFSTWLT